MAWGSHLIAAVKEGLRPVVDLVYPPRCPLCGDGLSTQGGLCPDCWNTLEFPERSLSGPEGSECCCANQTPSAGMHAATIYNDASRQLILAFKHGGKIALAQLMGRLMASALPQDIEAEAVLVPVPLHRWRIWQRGFNQSVLLAREIERQGKGTLLCDALLRKRRTPSLGGLGVEQRMAALKGAIAVRPSRITAISGRQVVLVDDVFTTGATSDACVESLIEAGAASVRVLCFARVG